MGTWWIEKPHLLGSSNPTDADLAQLRTDGFTVLVSLLREDEQPPRYDIARAAALGFVRHNLPVTDFNPPTVDQLEQFVRLVSGLSPGAKAIVHCEGGTGRTGTVAAAYWVAKGMTVADAIAHVRSTRRHAVETPEQEAALQTFANHQTGSPLNQAQRIPTPVSQDPARLAQLGDYVALVYHEARNVRHLIRAGAIESGQWKYLVALPVSRDEAWKELQGARAQARQATNPAGVLRVFEGRFRVSLSQLVALYGNHAWRNQPYGGNAWEAIAKLVGRLAACLEAGELSAADGLLEVLRVTRHNTGTVIDKLSRLDRSLGLEPGS